ncbi:MAG: NADH peroxidase [Bacilli bacterium]
MKKYICKACGYVHEGEEALEVCPICGLGKEMFEEIKEASYNEEATNDINNLVWTTEHQLKEAKEVELRTYLEGFVNGECVEVGLYFAFARQAYREGYPEIGEVLKNIAIEEAEHAASFNELLGNVGTTAENLEKMINGENGACKMRMELAIKAKQMNNDAVHDAVHESAKDEARHGRALIGMLKRYFNK